MTLKWEFVKNPNSWSSRSQEFKKFLLQMFLLSRKLPGVFKMV